MAVSLLSLLSEAPTLASGIFLAGDRIQCGEDEAFLVRRSPSASALAAVNLLAKDVTVLVSSSARPRDDGETNVRMLIDTVRSVRHGPLQLDGAHIVIVFDGLAGKPGVTSGMRSRYASKIRRTLAALGGSVSALIAEAWLHQANAMRCALEHVTPSTRLLLSIQDDTQVGGGGIDTETLRQRLLHDPSVEYVKFTGNPDCLDVRHHVRGGLEPCKPHPGTSLLHSTYRWVDRPHLATRAHYDARLFATLPRSAKATPEQWLDQRARAERNWPLWTYGARGDMARDLHWPILVDGKLVTKEFIPELRRQGKVGNITYDGGYAHSYLIHAYRGPDQDVKAKQIDKREFRAHNPLAWAAEDGLSSEDLGVPAAPAGSRPATRPSSRQHKRHVNKTREELRVPAGTSRISGGARAPGGGRAVRRGIKPKAAGRDGHDDRTNA